MFFYKYTPFSTKQVLYYFSVPYSYDQKNFETSFRYDLDPESIVIASNSLSDFGISLPYGLSFIPKIETVEIDNKLDGVKTLFHKKEIKKLTETINQFTIEKTVIENGDTKVTNINLIICTDGTMDIALEVFEQEDKIFIKEFLEHQPLLFCPFPLIGANDFKFPTIINSSSFIPKEERDGIWLDNAGYGISNQSLFEKVIPLYFSLCTYASLQNWKQTFLLFKSLNENILFSDFNEKWFKEKVQAVLKSSVLQIPLVDIPNGQRLSASSIYFQNETKEENRL